MKKCTVCGKKKQKLEFNKNHGRSDGLQSICKSCSSSYSKKYYQKNKNRLKKSAAEHKRRRREHSRKMVLSLLSSSNCVDCGAKDVRVLEFHHIDPINKMNTVSEMISTGYEWDTVSTEIEKCVIVCANCHRIRTHTQTNSYKADI